MFSLARFVNEQMNYFGDILDKRPSQVSRSTRDPLALVIDVNLPLKSKVATLLSSELPSQKVWAIRNIANLVAQDVPCDDLIAEIPRLMWSSSAKVELAAANTAYALLYRFPERYTHVFIGPILERIAAVPAIEYAECIEKMAATIQPDDVNNAIIPLLDKLFEQDLGHQHAACMLLKFLPIVKLAVSPDLFAKYLRSTVLVKLYLPEIAERWAKKFGEDWIGTRLPNELLRLPAEYRIGVVIFFSAFLDRIRIPGLASTLSTMCDWGQTNTGIALALLRGAPMIMKSRFTDIGQKILAFVPMVAGCIEESPKIELVSLLAQFPVLLTGNENTLYRVFSSLGSDRLASVRIAFLNKIQELYERVPTWNLRNGVVQVYQSMFGDKDMSVLACLANPFMLIRFVEMRSAVAPSIIADLAGKFKTQWRVFSKLLTTLEQFPLECLESVLNRFLDMIEDAVGHNSQSLAAPAVSFYRFLIHARLEYLDQSAFLRYIYAAYGGSNQFRRRMVYLQFANVLLEEFSREEFLAAVWPDVLGFANERVAIVRAKVLEFVIAFGTLFHSRQSPDLSGQIEDLIRRYRTDKDPEVIELLGQAQKFIGERRPRSPPSSDEPQTPPTKVRSPRAKAHLAVPQANRGRGEMTPSQRGGALRQRIPTPRVVTPITRNGSVGTRRSVVTPPRAHY
jgi:hypothetical protein